MPGPRWQASRVRNAIEFPFNHFDMSFFGLWWRHDGQCSTWHGNEAHQWHVGMKDVQRTLEEMRDLAAEIKQARVQPSRFGMCVEGINGGQHHRVCVGAGRLHEQQGTWALPYQLP